MIILFGATIKRKCEKELEKYILKKILKLNSTHKFIGDGRCKDVVAYPHCPASYAVPALFILKLRREPSRTQSRGDRTFAGRRTASCKSRLFLIGASDFRPPGTSLQLTNGLKPTRPVGRMIPASCRASCLTA